jgi:hypothetical protein
LRRDSNTELTRIYNEVHGKLSQSPLGFGFYFCPEYFRVTSAGFHVKIATEMMVSRRLGIAAPRESAKSSLASFLKTLHAVCYKHKNHVIIIQNTLSKACSSLYAVKHQIKYNEKIRACFGISFIKDATDETIFVHPDGTQIRVVCKGKDQMGSIRGERFNEWRPDLILGDDIEDDEMVRSPERRRELREVFDDAVEPAVDREKGQIILIGTVLHDDALIARVVGNEYYLDWRKLKYKALHEGRSLWPEKWSVEALQAIEANNPDKFAKEYQNDPVSGRNSSFNREDFRYWTIKDGCAVLYNADDEVQSSYELRSCVAAVGCDLAWEEKRNSDFTALIPGLLTPGNEILMDEYFCKKGVRPDELVELIYGMDAKYSAMTGGVVTFGFEKAKHEKIMKWMLGKEMKRRGKYLVLKDVRWDGDKITRIITKLQPRYHNHAIFHRRNFGEYENQLLRVPDGTHDDLPDAAQILERLLRYPKTGKKVETVDSEFDWLRNKHIQKNRVKPFVFGHKQARAFPFKTTEAYR